MSKDKKLQIRNSTAEFLIFTRQAGDAGIEVRVAEETVWLTQKLMAALFEVTVPTINEHLANLLAQDEIAAAATVRNFRTVQREGHRDVSRNVDFYNLDAIIAVGFRVNSARATQFRQWAIAVLRDFAIRGYVLDKERLKNGAFLSREYYDMYLDYAEDQAERGIPMTMQDWATKLNAFLQFNERDLLNHPGKVTAEVAKAFAESEFEKYRVVQDRLFESDFDRAIKKLPEKNPHAETRGTRRKKP
jgi:hypothetical protein